MVYIIFRHLRPKCLIFMQIMAGCALRRKTVFGIIIDGLIEVEICVFY